MLMASLSGFDQGGSLSSTLEHVHSIKTRILRGVGCKVSAWEQLGAARDYQRAARPVAAYPAAAYPVAAWRCESVGNERVG